MSMLRQFREFLAKRNEIDSYEKRKQLYAKVFAQGLDYALLKEFGKTLEDGYSIEIILPGQAGSTRIIFRSPRSELTEERQNHW